MPLTCFSKAIQCNKVMLTLKAVHLDLNPVSTISHMCDSGHIPSPFCAPVPLSMTQGWKEFLLENKLGKILEHILPAY